MIRLLAADAIAEPVRTIVPASTPVQIVLVVHDDRRMMIVDEAVTLSAAA